MILATNWVPINPDETASPYERGAVGWEVRVGTNDTHRVTANAIRPQPQPVSSMFFLHGNRLAAPRL